MLPCQLTETKEVQITKVIKSKTEIKAQYKYKKSNTHSNTQYKYLPAIEAVDISK